MNHLGKRLYSTRGLTRINSLLLMLFLPFIGDFAILLYIAKMIATPLTLFLVTFTSLTGGIIGLSVLKHRINVARRSYRETKIIIVMGTYLPWLYLIVPGVVSTLLGMLGILKPFSYITGKIVIKSLGLRPKEIFGDINIYNSLPK